MASNTNFDICRNDVSPLKGIDTIPFLLIISFIVIGRNDVSPLKGIDTYKTFLNWFLRNRRNDVSPLKGIDTCQISHSHPLRFCVEME